MKRLLAFLVGLSLCFPAPGFAWWKSIQQVVAVSGQQFFVASTGNNANPGTQASPWLDLTNVNSHAFGPNDCVNFNGGDTFGNSTTGINSATLACATSYGTGKATISSGNSAAGLVVENIPGAKFTNINYVGGGATSNTTQGVLIENSNSSGANLVGPVFDGNTVSGYGQDCILVNSVHGPGFSNATVTNNVFHDCTEKAGVLTAGINFSTSQVPDPVPATSFTGGLISGNTVFNINGFAGAINWTGIGIWTEGATGVVIEHNYVHDTGLNSNSSAGPVCISANDSLSLIIRYNEVWNCRTGNGVDGDGIDLDGNVSNSLVEYNYVHDVDSYGLFGFNFDSGVSWGGNTYRFNIVVNSTLGGINIQQGPGGGAITNTQVYNNTVYAAPNGEALTSLGASVEVTFSNNIAYCLEPTAATNPTCVNVPSPSSQVFTGNNYYGTGDFAWNGTSYPTFAAWQTASGQEKIGGVNVGKNVEPQLVVYGYDQTTSGYNPSALPQYQLQGTSPMLGGGIDITAQYSISIGPTDFYGAAIASASKVIGAGQAMTWTSGTGTCSQATAFLGRLSGSPTTALQQQYNALLCGSVVDGNLSHLFALYKLATDTTANANLNLISSSFPITVSGSPVFTANVGYTSNGVNTLFDTGFVPSTSGATLNSFALGGYDLSTGTVATDTGLMGATASNDSDTSSIFPMNDFIGGITAWGPINFSGDSSGFQPNSQLKGLYVAIRTGVNAQGLYKDAALINTNADTSTALPDLSILLLSTNGPASDPPVPSSDQGAYFFIADGSINPVLLSWRINADATALGINAF